MGERKKSAIDVNSSDVIIQNGKEYAVEYVTFAPGKVNIYTRDGRKITVGSTKKMTVKTR